MDPPTGTLPRTRTATRRAGDEPPDARFRAVFAAHHGDVWRYCLRRAASPADAEDVLSDTFAVAWRKVDELPEGDGARPWLFAIARNHLRNLGRSHKRAERLTHRISTARIADAPDPASMVAAGTDEVLRALASLNDDDQELLRLAAWEQLPHREIADVLDCSENAVAIRLHRARGRLTSALNTTHSTRRTTTKETDRA